MNLQHKKIFWKRFLAEVHRASILSILSLQLGAQLTAHLAQNVLGTCFANTGAVQMIPYYPEAKAVSETETTEDT